MAEYKQYITQDQENGSVMISEDVIATIRTYSSKRKQAVPNLTAFPGDTLTMPMEVMVGGATIFVTDVARFEKF